MKEVIDVLHRHCEILEPEFKRKNGIPVQFRFVNLVSTDRHSLIIVVAEMAKMLTEQSNSEKTARSEELMMHFNRLAQGRFGCYYCMETIRRSPP